LPEDVFLSVSFRIKKNPVLKRCDGIGKRESQRKRCFGGRPGRNLIWLLQSSGSKEGIGGHKNSRRSESIISDGRQTEKEKGRGPKINLIFPINLYNWKLPF